ncbi:MAG: FAD binding domain-containing protein [Acidobacteria bacterium]|nr:FAD binding domain-containing protein [Acidobacteriota bacterium]
MIEFILNNEKIATDRPSGTTILDFVRYNKSLTGTKIGCREGDCGACTVLVGELAGGTVQYRSVVSCLMPLAAAQGKHIVTIEGITPADGSLTSVQQAMVDESGTQCGFCTPGFVMSLTGFCVNAARCGAQCEDPERLLDTAVSAIDGNICRCTGYKSIERAARQLCGLLSEPPASAGGQFDTTPFTCVPPYFADIAPRLRDLVTRAAANSPQTDRLLTQAVLTGGGTDLYVQRPEQMADNGSIPLLYDDSLRGVRDNGEFIEIGAAATVSDLLNSDVMRSIFPDLAKHLKLVSSTPIRNMATIAGNFVNASPIGDMTVWFLALDAEIDLSEPPASAGGRLRSIKLRDLYLGYKQLAKQPDEIITTIRFKKPPGDFRFNFEKVCKRTYLDIATVNTAISLTVRTMPGEGWTPPALSEPGAIATGPSVANIDYTIIDAHVAAGGVAAIPLYLKETSAFLKGKRISEETINAAGEIMQSEVSPISDVRGTEHYKRLLLRQLFRAHFEELFGTNGAG